MWQFLDRWAGAHAPRLDLREGRMMPYWRIFFHLVWATKQRESTIDEIRERLIQQSVIATCEAQGASMLALGFMPDYVHAAISVPPRIAVSELMRRINGSSSHLVNDVDRRTFNGFHERFFWQEEYGVLSFGERSLESVVSYVNNQRQHHSRDTILAEFERLERPYERKVRQ
jgi:putative transposase